MSTGSSSFLRAWCWGVGLFGLVLIGGAFPATEGPTLALYDLFDGARTPVFGPEMRFTLGILGAVTMGWAVTLYAAIKAGAERGAQGGPIWRLTALGVASWYVVDSALSIATGYPLNAVSNTVLAGAFLIPVWRSGVLRG